MRFNGHALDREDNMFEFSTVTIALLVGIAFVGMLVVMISVASSGDEGHHSRRP